MPLFEMSANVQEPDSVSRKRSHDEFSGDAVKMDVAADDKTPSKTAIRPSGDSLLFPMTQSLIESSPQGSPALTEAGSSTPARNSPSPQTPTKGPADNTTDNAQTSNSAKRKKLTTAEKEVRDKEAAEKKEQREREAAQKKKEREEKAAQRAAEKAKQDEEKVARMKEKEEKRKKKEEEERLKNQQREEKKKQKEEELQRIQEEKDKKARAQPTLGNFFKLPNTPKKPTPEAVATDGSPKKDEGTPCEDGKPTESEYQKMFKPFFLKENTTMATFTNMDEETREAKSQILDECISGNRENEAGFDAVKLFALPAKPRKRGKSYMPVRHIMETAYKDMQQLGGNGDAATAMQAAKSSLAQVTVKVIAFSQDVRPPYYGTVTFKPFTLGQTRMGRVARRSADRRLPLEYDYDSEAEWQEEEGEDVDVDDDDEELDDEDDMDGFLDDSEDTGLSRRIFANVMEPDSTGLCFENEKRKRPNSAVCDNKMEIILDSLDITASIDPFTTSYWEPEPRANISKTTQAAGAKLAMLPPPAPANAFAALNGGTTTDNAQAKLVKAELLNDVKKAILQNKALSKVGIIDFIFQQFRDNVSRAEVKNTLELVAEKKKGSGRMKEWDLKPGHEIAL